MRLLATAFHQQFDFLHVPDFPVRAKKRIAVQSLDRQAFIRLLYLESEIEWMSRRRHHHHFVRPFELANNSNDRTGHARLDPVVVYHRV